MILILSCGNQMFASMLDREMHNIL